MATTHSVPRVVYLLDDLGGGTGNHLLSLVRQWDRRRLQADIVSEAALTARVPPAIPIEFLPARRWFDRYPAAQVHRLAQFGRAIARRAPDVVHSYFLWPILYGRLLKRMGKIRLLVENREDEGFGWHRQAYSLLRWTHAMPDRVICVSDAVRDVVLARERLDPGRVVVIRNGIDSGAAAAVNRDARKDFGIADHELVVGMVANFNRPVKGVTYFLDAIPAIVRQVPHSRFLILGGGDEHQALRDKARALNIEPYLIFGGYRGDVERCYGAMDVSVLTSLSEGLSITLLESMRHSLPIVATAVGGNPEVVVQGETGYLVPPRDVPAFARRVVRLLRDPALRARMGNSGRLRVARHFDIGAVAQRYLDVYADLLEQRAAAA